MTRQDRAEATRWQILESAARNFLKNGYSGANVNEIVAQADVTKGALYFHFESKAILAHELIAERDRRLAQALAAVDESPLPALEKIIHSSIVMSVLVSSDVFFQVGDQLLLEVRGCEGSAGRSLGMPLDRLSDLVALAIVEGDVVKMDPDLTAHLMLVQSMGSRVVARTVDGEYDLLTYLEKGWELLIRSIVSENVQPYFHQLVARMIATQRTLGQAVGVGG